MWDAIPTQRAPGDGWSDLPSSPGDSTDGSTVKTLIITISIPDDAEIDVRSEVSSNEPARPTEPEVSPDVRKRIGTAKRGLRPFMLQYIERCASELACRTVVPTGKREDYLNTFPPVEYKRKRVSSLTITSGRLEIYCDPSLAERFPNAEEDLHNGVPVQVKLYLQDEQAVDSALELTRLAIEALDE